MDHLELSATTHGGVFYSVPCASNLRYNPIDGFHAFPQSVGWDVDDQHGCHYRERHEGFVEFLQAWLFFGLLHTVLGDSSEEGFDVHSAFMRNGHGSYVSTQFLGNRLRKWKEWEETQWAETLNRRVAEQNFNIRMVKIQMVLDRSKGVLKRYCSEDGPKPTGDEYRMPEKDKTSDFDMISLSLIVLGETISNAKARIVEQIGFKVRGWHGDSARDWGTSSLIKSTLRNEWCKKTIPVLEGQLRGNTTGLLAAYSLQLFKDEDHKPCSEQFCHIADIGDEDAYLVQHHKSSKEDCGHDCDWEGPDPKELQTIINSGAIPILLLAKNSSTVKVQLTDSRKCNEYATISHVWSDGYGNPRENKLRHCQLRFLKDALVNIRPTPIYDQKIAFWMDTLAIPVGEDYKTERKIAIGKIHEIFVRSRHTVVIDKGLYQARMGDQYHLIAMKILASRWMRRLWTLQEAYLSERIFFKFHEKEPLDLEVLERMYPHANDTLDSCIPAMARSYFYGLLGTARRARIHEMTPKEGLGLISSVWKATQWRSTSRQQHEVLALATLFDLNTNHSKGASQLNESFVKDNADDSYLDGNMRTLLKLLEEVYPGSIPAGMIFVRGDKLSGRGYGWAPRTWISAQMEDYPDALSLDTPPSRLIPEKGLLVQFPGFLLHPTGKGNPITQLEGRQSLRFPTDSTLTEWYEVKQADDATTSGVEEQGATTDIVETSSYAIILPRQRPRDVEEIALFVTTGEPQRQRSFDHAKETHILHASVLFRIRIKRVTRMPKKNVREFYGEPRGVFGEILDQDQKWCVDGRRSNAEQGQTLNGAESDSVNGMRATKGSKEAGPTGEKSGSQQPIGFFKRALTFN